MTAYPFADPGLLAQMRRLVIVDEMGPGDGRSHKREPAQRQP